MVKAYGNHPSFCMLAAGNEPAGKKGNRYQPVYSILERKDNRRLYRAQINGYELAIGARKMSTW